MRDFLAAMMRGFQAATPPGLDTVSDEVKSALKKAKADAENQKREGSDKAKSIEEKLRAKRRRAQERAEQEPLEAVKGSVLNGG